MRSEADITRSAVSVLRVESMDAAAGVSGASASSKLIDQANAACDRLEQILGRIKPPATHKVALAELIALRVRIADLANRGLKGSDCQTP